MEHCAEERMLRLVGPVVLVAGLAAVIGGGQLARSVGFKGGLQKVLGDVLTYAGPISMLATLVIILGFIGVVAASLPGLLTRRRRLDGGLLLMVGLGAPLLALAAAATEAWIIHVAQQRVSPVPFEVIAPGVAAAILVAGIGLTAGGLVLILRSFVVALGRT